MLFSLWAVSHDFLDINNEILIPYISILVNEWVLFNLFITYYAWACVSPSRVHLYFYTVYPVICSTSRATLRLCRDEKLRLSKQWLTYENLLEWHSRWISWIEFIVSIKMKWNDDMFHNLWFFPALYSK